MAGLLLEARRLPACGASGASGRGLVERDWMAIKCHDERDRRKFVFCQWSLSAMGIWTIIIRRCGLRLSADVLQRQHRHRIESHSNPNVQSRLWLSVLAGCANIFCGKLRRLLGSILPIPKSHTFVFIAEVELWRSNVGASSSGSKCVSGQARGRNFCHQRCDRRRLYSAGTNSCSGQRSSGNKFTL